MSKRIDRSWAVFNSIENAEHDQCVDFFVRPDRTFGFELFRRDVEDRGAWTPLQYYAASAFASPEEAYAAAENAVVWLGDRLRSDPALRRPPRQGKA